MNSQKPGRKKPSENRGNVRHTVNKKPVNPGRHEYHCTICSHAQRDEVERAFLNWNSPSSVSKLYSVSRDSIYCQSAGGSAISQKLLGLSNSIPVSHEEVSESGILRTT